MKLSRATWLCLSVLIVVAMFGGLVVIHEPDYGGRSLNSWLADVDYGLPSFNRQAAPKAEESIRKIGPRAVPALQRMMRARDDSILTRARRWLSQQKFLKVSPPVSAEHLQWRGTRGVQILGPEGAAAVPSLILLLTNKSSWVRGGAAQALRQIGPKAQPAVPFLIKALDDPVTDVRNCVCYALQNIGAKEAIPSLIKHLEDSNEQARTIALSTVISLSDDKSLVVPHLIRHLDDQYPDVRGTIAVQLGMLDNHSPLIVTNLQRLLEDRDKWVRRAATNALRQLDGTAPPPLPRGEGAWVKFVNADLRTVLDYYSELTQKKLEIAPNVPRNAHITIKHYGALSAEDIAALIEQELKEQAGIFFVPITDDRVSVRAKR